jgi:methionine-rich copper-binding protein CopC
VTRCLKAGAVLFAACVVTLLAAGPAAAHSVLLATSPVTSSRIASAPAVVVLTFNEMPRGEYSDIHVVGPDGARRDSGHVKVLNDTVSEALGGTRPAGLYTVDWRVISADGHPVSGQFTFTAAAQAPALGARQPDTVGAAATKKSSSSTGIVVVIVIVGLLIVVAAIVVLLRRRRPADTSRQPRGDQDVDE